MESPNTILFDFDGTLFDLNGFLAKYAKEFIQSHHLQTEKSPYEFYREISHGVSNLNPDLVEEFRTHMKERMPKEIPLIDGVKDTLEELKSHHIRLGIVSTGYVERLTKILEAQHLISYFDVLIGREDTPNQKPSPDPILKALEKLKQQPEKVLYMGDHEVDMVSGQAAGVGTIFFAINKPYAEVLAPWLKENPPTYIVETFTDLKQIIL